MERTKLKLLSLLLMMILSVSFCALAEDRGADVEAAVPEITGELGQVETPEEETTYMEKSDIVIYPYGWYSSSTSEPEKVSISSKSAIVHVGEALTLQAKIQPSDAVSGLTWKSSDDDVAVVDEDGIVIGVHTGSAKITVTTDNGKKASKTVKVIKRNNPTGVRIEEGSSIQLEVGETWQLRTTLLPNDQVNPKLTWTNSNKKAVELVEGYPGKIKAVRQGTSRITVKTVNGKRDSITVKVVDPTDIAAVGSATSVTLPVGRTWQVGYSISAYDPLLLVWESEDEDIASVDDEGIIEAHAKGDTVVIGRLLDEEEPVIEVKVKVISASGEVAQNGEKHITLATGRSWQLSFTDDTVDEWTSSRESVAVVEDGIVTAVKPGSASIVAITANGKKVTIKVDVKNPIVLNTRSVTVKVGKTVSVPVTLGGDVANVRVSAQSNSSVVKPALTVKRQSVNRKAEAVTGTLKIKGRKVGNTVLELTDEDTGYSVMLKVKVVK